MEMRKIALRNLARHKVKTVITVLAIMVSVALYIFMDGMISGMSVESRRNIVNYEIGAAKLQTKMYFEKKDELPSYENFAGARQFMDILENAGYNAAPRYVFSGTLYSMTGSAPILFNGVDPAAEPNVLRYTSFMESGRYIKSGNIELAVGTMAAEKLKVGIPMRPYMQELNDIADMTAGNQSERDFIFSLYEPFTASTYSLFAAAPVVSAENPRMVYKKNIPQQDTDRFWNMLAQTGRNDVQISAVIDIKAAPETISSSKWDGELWPALRPEDQPLVKGAYEYQDFMDAWLLTEEDPAILDQVLQAMIRAEYSGAVRHVNQLISAIVVGIINSPDPVTNGNMAYIPLDVLDGEEGMMLGGNVTEILIRDKHSTDAQLPGRRESSAAITAVLENGMRGKGLAFPAELGVFTWMDYVKDYLGYEQLENGATKVLVIILFIIAFLGISNTILLAILERTKEIGMMRALGMSDGELRMVFMFEAGYLGLFGSVLGIVLGCLLNYPMVKYGIDVSAMGDALGGGIGFRVTALFRSMWNLPVIIGSGIFATLLSSLMAFFPIGRALKMPITDSMRFE